MEESVTYQAILQEGFAIGYARGIVKAARRVLLRGGTRRLGPPPSELVAAVEANSDLGKLEAMVDRVDDASTWQEVLGDRTA